MFNTIIPLVNWGLGTGLIIVFAVVCIVMAAIVIGLIMRGKSKDKKEDKTEDSPLQNEPGRNE